MTVEKISVDNHENYDNFPVGMRVLAVDDDPICLKLLDTLLRKCQYHVTTTPQARMALKMLRENRERFDLVISDVHMPDMDGFKLLELVGLEMDLPVIMLSANSDPKLVLKGVTHGACDYLVKPVRIEELRNVWQHVIRRKKLDSRNRNKSSDQDKGTQGSGDGHGSPMAGNDGKFNRKRKEEEEESEDNENEGDDPATQKKPRVVWSIELHRKFVAAVNQLGIEKAVPKRILDLMNVEGLTRENVASHLQKYRLYLKRISSVASQQANMVAALGVKDSLHMGLYEALGDFRALSGPGRLANAAALSPYTSGGMLSRLNTPVNVNLRNLTPPSLVQPIHASLGKVLPSANQNLGLFQGIPSSLELDQLQQNKCATSIVNFDSRTYAASTAFADPGVALGSTSNMILQTFGSQTSHNMASFNLDSFNASSNLLDPGSIESSKMQQQQQQQPNSMIVSEAFHAQLPGRENNYSNGPYLQNNPIDGSSALHLEVPREMQFQEGMVGYDNCSKSSFTPLSTRDEDNAVSALNHNLEQDSGMFNQKIGMFGNGRVGGSGSTFMQQNGNEKMTGVSRTKFNDAFLLEQSKLQGGFNSRGYDSLDDMMNAMIKREQEENVPNCDFGFDDYSFGAAL